MLKRTVEEFLSANGLYLESVDRTALVSVFLKEMEEGLLGRASSLKMIRAHLSPEGAIRRNCRVAALDAGGTNLRSAVVAIPSDGSPARIEHKEKRAMPGTTSNVTADEFYGVFAGELARVMPFADAPEIGWCFSYAAEAAPNGDARLLYWSKEIRAPEVVGQWVGAELAKRLPAPPPRLAVLNDTVATLLAGKVAEDPNARYSGYIGFILGTGTNVAYYDKALGTVINAESGGFARAPRSSFDDALNAKTQDPQAYLFEKMISGAYLGRLGLEVLKAAAREDFFSAQAARAVRSLGTLESADLDGFCAASGDVATNPLARVFSDAADAALARRLVLPVFERAAALTAIHLAAFAIKTGGGADPLAPICLSIDGSTYYKTRTVDFPAAVESALKLLLGRRNISFKLEKCPDDAPIVGAAIAALMDNRISSDR